MFLWNGEIFSSCLCFSRPINVRSKIHVQHLFSLPAWKELSANMNLIFWTLTNLIWVRWSRSMVKQSQDKFFVFTKFKPKIFFFKRKETFNTATYSVLFGWLCERFSDIEHAAVILCQRWGPWGPAGKSNYVSSAWNVAKPTVAISKSCHFTRFLKAKILIRPQKLQSKTKILISVKPATLSINLTTNYLIYK